MRELLFQRLGRRRTLIRLTLVAGGVLGFAYATSFSGISAERSRRLPTAWHDVADQQRVQTAVFAGGCFWGMQGVFQHVKGVIGTQTGYAGGSAETASYDQTETGTTGHAEAVKITFDSSRVSYATLLQLFLSVAHDPTQINRQGADVGTQYRSAVFPQDDDQEIVAADYINQLNHSNSYRKRIETTIEPKRVFYKAEGDHQNYALDHPAEPYILFTEAPKVEALKKLYPSLYRQDPVRSDAQS